MGNEAGDGPNFEACYDWVKAYDPTRPVQYERANLADHTDIFCPMYAPYDSVERYALGEVNYGNDENAAKSRAEG